MTILLPFIQSAYRNYLYGLSVAPIGATPFHRLVSYQRRGMDAVHLIPYCAYLRLLAQQHCTGIQLY